MISTHGDKFWSKPKAQLILIVICFLVSIPVLLYVTYDSNRDEVWIKNEFIVENGFTLGVKNLSDTVQYHEIISDFDSNYNQTKFQLIPTSKFMKVMETTPNEKYFKVKWKIEGKNRRSNKNYQCWVSSLLIEKTD